MFGGKRTVISFIIAVSFVLLFFSLTESSVSAIAWVLLWPGAMAATLAGYGRDDLQGFLLYILGNIAFYWLLVAFLLWFTTTHLHTSTGSTTKH